MGLNPKSILHGKSQASLSNHGRALLSSSILTTYRPFVPFGAHGKNVLQVSQPPNQSYLCKAHAGQMVKLPKTSTVLHICTAVCHYWLKS